MGSEMDIDDAEHAAEVKNVAADQAEAEKSDSVAKDLANTDAPNESCKDKDNGEETNEKLVGTPGAPGASDPQAEMESYLSGYCFGCPTSQHRTA
jgi:hypothetical protein